jgi:hypothetical protein
MRHKVSELRLDYDVFVRRRCSLRQLNADYEALDGVFI